MANEVKTKSNTRLNIFSITGGILVITSLIAFIVTCVIKSRWFADFKLWLFLNWGSTHKVTWLIIAAISGGICLICYSIVLVALYKYSSENENKKWLPIQALGILLLSVFFIAAAAEGVGDAIGNSISETLLVLLLGLVSVISILVLCSSIYGYFMLAI